MTDLPHRYNTPHHINPKKVEDLLLDSALNWKKGPILNPRTSTRSRYQAVGSIDDDQNDDARKKSRHVPGFSQDESSDDGMASVLPERYVFTNAVCKIDINRFPALDSLKI